MRISIAMATYNGSKYIHEQLNSFLCQTRQVEELVVCDDGSFDKTLEILEAFKQIAPFDMYIYRNEVNLGFTQNFNQALSRCTGDLILISDQDDVWFANKVELMEKAFFANPDKLLAIHDGLLVDEKLVWHGATNLGQAIAGYGDCDSIVTGALTAVRRDFLLFALPIPAGIVGHDSWLHNLAKLLNVRLVVNAKLQFIRRYSSNTSNWIASSTTPINRLNVLISQSLTNAAHSYEDRLQINESGRQRLKKILSIQSIIPAQVIETSLCNLIKEHEALHCRNILICSNFLDRKFMAFQMLFKGQYRYFNGINSFLRDFFR